MTSELSIKLRDYLQRCGCGGTRMYHDLGLYGDIAEACIDILADHYHVDLSGFEFERFFPQEFHGKNTISRVLLWIVPFAAGAVRRRGEYLPLTLAMIDDAIRSKRLGPAEHR